MIAVIVGALGWFFLQPYAAQRRGATGRATIIIEGCEYLGFATYYGYMTYTHKGNCTNATHNP